jgi:hypothetical protein
MKAIRTGMTIGMTAMGLPPSLPNWEQLKQQGIDYLAAEAGEQIEETTEIPGSGAVAEWALKQVAQKALDELTANRGWTATGYDWVGPYEGFDPASWVVEVKKLTTDPLPPGGRLEAVHDGSLPRRRRAAPAQVPRERHPAHPDGAPAERHGHRRTALPRVVLHRSAGQLLADLRRDEADLPEPDECTAHPGTLWHDDPGCSSLAELVAIYYRDAWVANKLDVESCTSLGAATFLKHVEITPSQDGWLSLGTSWTSSVSYEATPLLTMSMIGFVPPKVGATWSGPFFKAC